MKKRMRLIGLLVTLLLLVSVLGAVAAAPPPNGGQPPGLERAMEVQEKYNPRLMATPLVVGTGVGLTADGRPSITVFTLRSGASVPRALEGVPVQVVVTGMFVARSDPTGRFDRPVPIGVSTGHPDITAGTIGARVKDADGKVYALSNNHVYANSNEAQIGDSALQPGPYDGGTDPEDKIGQLHDFETIKFDGSDNTMDAAIASSTTSLLGFSTPSGAYGAPSATTAAATLSLKVQKFGRTTSWTHGEIDQINVTVDVCYETAGPFRCKKLARFVEQIVITPGSFSAGGDSGSLIVTDDGNKNPVGLLFAGSDTHTIANPIDDVLGRFGVTIDDGTGGGDAPPSVTITYPKDGDTVSDTVNVTADASDDNEVSQVEFFVEGGSIGVDRDGSDGWSASWKTTAYTEGSHQVTATATDTAGQTGSHTISVTVDNEPSAELTVTGITPNSMHAGTTINVTITGSGFVEGADVTFENGTGPAPAASAITVSDSYAIEATVTAKSGGPPTNRLWDVRVTNPDGSSAVLIGGLTVTP